VAACAKGEQLISWNIQGVKGGTLDGAVGVSSLRPFRRAARKSFGSEDSAVCDEVFVLGGMPERAGRYKKAFIPPLRGRWLRGE